MSELSVRETAARAAFEANPPKARHDGSDVTWHEATASPLAGHWVREVRMARRQGDAVLAAVAAHDGLAEVLRKHGLEDIAEVDGVLWCATCDVPLGTYGTSSISGFSADAVHAAHLADVVRAWLRGES